MSAQAIAANIRTQRSKAGLTQAELAHRMRDHGYRWYPQTVSRIEQGKPGKAGGRSLFAHEVIDLAAVLKTDPMTILRGGDGS